MKKIAFILTAFTVVTSTFAAPESKTPALYPMDSFNPNNFKASSASEFIKRYSSEAEVIFKKGEFETTADYNARIGQEFKPKSLDSDKIYAFKLDSISAKYNPDKASYEVRTMGDPSVGDIFENERKFSSNLDETYTYYLRVSKLNRKSDQYKGSNAYGRTSTIVRMRGTDFYIKSPTPFGNSSGKNRSNDYQNTLVFPTEVEIAKKNSSCNKEVYVFGQLTGEAYHNNPYDFAVAYAPKLDFPLDIAVVRKAVPMNVVGMVLKCSTGTILSTYTAPVNDSYKKTQPAEKVAIY